MKKVGLSLLSLILLGSLYQCKKENTTIDCSGTAPAYQKDVKPILDGNCAAPGCHASFTPSGGFNLSSYDGAKSAGANPKFLESVQHTGGAQAMPKNTSKLSEDKIKILYCWVQNGMPEN